MMINKFAFKPNLLFMIVFCLNVEFAPAQIIEATSEQRFFDWTKLQFEKEVYQNRRMNQINLLRTSGGGVLLIPSHHGVSDGTTFRQLSDFLYFTGLELPSSILAIDSDEEKSILFAPKRDVRFASASRSNDFPGRPLSDDPALAGISGIPNSMPFEQFAETIQKWIDRGSIIRMNLGRSGDIAAIKTEFIYDWSPVEAFAYHLKTTYPTIKMKNAFIQIAKMRMVKSPGEIEVIRRVCNLTIQAIKETARFVKNGIDERGLEAELEAVYKRGGAQRLAFSSIIKSGPNSLWPWRILAAHYERRNRIMKNGELVIFDVGTEFDYYISDVGRTFPVSGKFTTIQKQKLQMITAVSDAIMKAIKPGITFPQLKQIAIDNIPVSERKYMQTGSFFGHHIGLDVGDPSILDAPLSSGMVFTVEPWYYNHDIEIAVFIEDIVLVTENGAENLTAKLARSYYELEKLMKN